MTYADAVHQFWMTLLKGVQTREERALIHDGRDQYPIVIPPCPATIGNDPCDDWAPDWLDDEDEDWF